MLNEINLDISQTRWLIVDENASWFDTEKQIIEYLEEGLNSCDITRFDYIEKLFDEQDVFRKTKLLYKDGKLLPTYTSFETASQTSNNIKVLRKIKDVYYWQEYIPLNYFDEVVEAFKEKPKVKIKNNR